MLTYLGYLTCLTSYAIMAHPTLSVSIMENLGTLNLSLVSFGEKCKLYLRVLALGMWQVNALKISCKNRFQGPKSTS
jgi:hypothetical protein